MTKENDGKKKKYNGPLPEWAGQAAAAFVGGVAGQQAAHLGAEKAIQALHLDPASEGAHALDLGAQTAGALAMAVIVAPLGKDNPPKSAMLAARTAVGAGAFAMAVSTLRGVQDMQKQIDDLAKKVDTGAGAQQHAQTDSPPIQTPAELPHVSADFGVTAAPASVTSVHHDLISTLSGPEEITSAHSSMNDSGGDDGGGIDIGGHGGEGGRRRPWPPQSEDFSGGANTDDLSSGSPPTYEV